MLKAIVVSLVIMASSACGSTNTTITTSLTKYIAVEPLVDLRDGRSYPVVAIGEQVWMARNVAFPTDPSWCYEDEPGDCEANGRLYPWAKVGEACPGGWHVPSDEEWIEMERRLGLPKEELRIDGFRGTDQGARLRRGGNTEFSAQVSGYRRPDGSYARRGERSAFWTSTAADDSAAWHRDVRSDDDRVYRNALSKEYALSVRCVRD